ncbi:MAG: hypothetical protein RLO81_05475, partial [Fulvivirga sp.]|uniref:hypothetical protein n=1 Tax=Fulvivirga sp. TaxID=1931237 RepID=UPI0032EED8F2
MIRRVYDKLNALFIAANIAGTSVIWKIDSGNDESFMITMPSVVHLSSLRDAVSGQVLKDKMAIASSGTQLMTYYGVQMVTMNRIIPVWRKKILWQLVDPYYFKGSLKLNYFRFLFSYRLKKSREVIDEAVLLDTSWSGNYFHWMYDVLCRVFMFSDTSKNKEVVLLTGSRLSNFQKDSLDYLGLSNRVKVLKNNASVNTLYGHSYMMSDNIFDRDLLQKFRQFALSKLQPVIKKFET